MDVVFELNLNRFDQLLDQGYRFIERIQSFDNPTHQHCYIFQRKELSHELAS
nr:MAG: hypothetical protein [Microvirus sp.]